KYWWKN
nr:Chain P, Synaptobrevin-2 juxtamembrane linker peptide [Rattus norvegicus]